MAFYSFSMAGSVLEESFHPARYPNPLRQPGLATGAQIYSPKPFHRWGKGCLLFSWGGEDCASFSGHFDWTPSSSLLKVLSENNLLLRITAVTSTSAQIPLLVWISAEWPLSQTPIWVRFPGLCCNQALAISLDKVVRVPPVDWITTDFHCRKLHGLPALVCCSDMRFPACGLDPLLPRGRTFTFSLAS